METTQTKIITVGITKSPLNKKTPRIRISGFWLNEIGFKKDSLVSVEHKFASIFLKLEGEGIATYSNIIKNVMKTKSSLIQIKNESSNGKPTPHIEFKGLYLNNIGFCIGSTVALQYGSGFMKLWLLDLEKLCAVMV